MKNKPAWHFLPKNGRLQYGDNRKPRTGVVHRATGDLKMCENGMHASTDIMDALRYAPGPILCRVELVPPMIEGNNKICARGRKVLARADVSNVLHRFAVSCARRALRQAGMTDRRCWEACTVKLRWLDGKASDNELAAARAAADEAAWEAARKAAWAAWEAARKAAWAAAAARAARAVAWAASAAARAAQKKSLLRLLRKHHPELFNHEL